MSWKYANETTKCPFSGVLDIVSWVLWGLAVSMEVIPLVVYLLMDIVPLYR